MKIRTELWLLVTAVVVMLVGALASLAVLRRASQELGEAHELIARNAGPTIVALDKARADLRQLQPLLVEQMLGAPGDPAVRRSSIEAARRDLARDIAAYIALPTDPGEALIQREIREALAHLELVVDRAAGYTPAPTQSELGVQRDLDAAVGRLGRELARGSEFSAELATRSADDVAEVSDTELPLAAAIEALTIVAAALTLALTYRAVRRAEALADRSLATVARRAEELEAFSGRVAHDLLSPLMTVSLALDLAGRRLADQGDGPALSAVGRASSTLQRVRRFVSDLLEFARAGARPAPGARASVNEVVHEIADEFSPIARDAGVELRVDALPRNRDVACSPGVLMSALANLVQNAIKFLGPSEERRVVIRTVEGPDEVQIEVEDTGPGVPPEDRVRLFEPYTRGRDPKAPGLGLGLATVRRLVESHGGHVGVRPAPEHGSVFWFSLPVAA